jgi:hypothetical protein
MTSFVNRHTQAPVRFAIEAAALVDFLSRTHNNLAGRLLEGLSKLFAQNVRVYVIQRQLPPCKIGSYPHQRLAGNGKKRTA